MRCRKIFQKDKPPSSNAASPASSTPPTAWRRLRWISSGAPPRPACPGSESGRGNANADLSLHLCEEPARDPACGLPPLAGHRLLGDLLRGNHREEADPRSVDPLQLGGSTFSPTMTYWRKLLAVAVEQPSFGWGPLEIGAECNDTGTLRPR